MTDEFAEIEASHATAAATAPPAAEVAAAEPPPPVAPPGTTVEMSLEQFSAPAVNLTPGLETPPTPAAPAPQPPAPVVPPAAPAAPEPPAPAPAAEEEPAAPVVAPKTPLPEGTPRNYRVAAKDPVEALALQIRVRNPDISLGDAWARAQTELGVAPAAPAAPEAPQHQAPPPPADPLAELDARLQAIETEKNDLDPIIDAAELRRLDNEAFSLLRNRTDLVAERRVQDVLASRDTEAQQANAADAAIAASLAAAQAAFPQLADPNSEFSQAYTAAHERMVAAEDPLLGHEDYEVRLAQMVAGELFSQGKLTPAATSPGAPPPGSPPTAAPASAPASTAPAPAGVAPVPGSAMSAEHRIQVQATDPAQQLAAELAQAQASGDFEALEAAHAKAVGGGRPAPANSGFSISIGGQRVA